MLRMKFSNDLLMTINQRFEVIVLPQALTEPALQSAHEGLGHNGIPRTYALLRRQYYWKGLKPSVTKHVKQCILCQGHNKPSSQIQQTTF